MLLHTFSNSEILLARPVERCYNPDKHKILFFKAVRLSSWHFFSPFLTNFQKLYARFPDYFYFQPEPVGVTVSKGLCRKTDEEICRYTGELRTVFGFRKYADDRKQLDRFIAANPGHFNNVSKTAVNALAELTHSPRLREILTPQYQTKKGGFNMCKGLDGMIQEGVQKGLRDGLQKGILTGKQEMAVSLSAMGMSVEKIAKAAKVSEGVVRGWLSGSAG